MARQRCLRVGRYLLRGSIDCKLLIGTKRCLSTDADLGKRSFWQERYADGKVKKGHDWLAADQSNFADILSKIEQLAFPADEQLQVLDIGCGVSELPGYILRNSAKPLHMWCLDYTNGAIEWQKKRHWSSHAETNSNSDMSFVISDACKLPFKNEFFNVILDKGTLDSLLKVEESGKNIATEMLKESLRTLHKHGRLLQITDEDPDVRLLLLEDIFKQLTVAVHISYDVLSSDHHEGYECFMYSIAFNLHRHIL